MDMEKGTCPVCDFVEAEHCNEPVYRTTDYIIKIFCPRCGRYTYQSNIIIIKRRDNKIKDIAGDKLHLFIGFTREQTINNKQIDIKNIEDIEDYVEYAIKQAPNDVDEKINTLLLNIARMCQAPGRAISINSERDYPLAYCRDVDEFREYMQYLLEGKFIKEGPSYYYSVTIEGWKIIREYKNGKDLTQCFVAMWFDDNNIMLPVYTKYISQAVEDAGYKPMIVSNVKHDNEVTSQILAEIQKSKFVIADFTGQRAGVYFEAGFAKGLGLNVIWTCKKDWFDTKDAETDGEYKIKDKWEKGKIKEERRTHFDVNHRQFILWEDAPEEKLIKFKDDIYNSIVEQFGEGPLKNNEEVNT